MRNNMSTTRSQSKCMEVAIPNDSMLGTAPGDMVHLREMYHGCNDHHNEKYEGTMITFDRFIAIYQSQHGTCADTGVSFDWASKDLMPSADRIDNDVGYIDGNVRFVTRRVNGMRMRGGLSVEGFHAICMQMAHHNNKRELDAVRALVMLRG